jgi:hypothetical protein
VNSNRCPRMGPAVTTRLTFPAIAALSPQGL